MACKKLKKHNRQLEKKNGELTEQVRELAGQCEQQREARIKIETHLETLQEQLAKHEAADRQNLIRVVPVMQEAIMLIHKTATADSSGAQRTLKKIKDLLYKEASREKAFAHARTKNRESVLSAYSDSSSIAESFSTEEQVSQSCSCGSLRQADANATIPQSDSEKAAVSTADGRQRSMTEQNAGARERPEIPAKPLQIQMDATKSPPPSTVSSSSRDKTEMMMKEGHNDVSRDHQGAKRRSNSHPRKGRHHSVSGGNTEYSTKHNRSQSLKYSNTKIDHASRPLGTQGAYINDAELKEKLERRRREVEQENEK